MEGGEIVILEILLAAAVVSVTIVILIERKD